MIVIRQFRRPCEPRTVYPLEINSVAQHYIGSTAGSLRKETGTSRVKMTPLGEVYFINMAARKRTPKPDKAL